KACYPKENRTVLAAFTQTMDQLNNLTLWDVKDAFNKVKNVVMNYTEMEAKVREATNNEPWGASSTLMQEIAQGTYSYQSFNEIMTTIYKRFTEKEARQWRQIYKALQLLEYLVKHGSERVVDDARSHMGTVKIMRNFAYIDDKGKDQGVNVRSRARELAELLSDVEKIRQERRKAKANRTKYTGVSSDAIGYGGSSSRYGGFGNDSFYYNEDRTRSRYDEPDSQWQSDYSRADRNSFNEERRTSSSSASRLSQTSNKKIAEPSTAATNLDEPATANTEINLFDFDDAPNTNPNSAPQSDFGAMQTAFIDDDFQDFQSAPLTTPSQRSSISMNSTNLTGLQFTSAPKTNIQPVNNSNVPKNNTNAPQVNNDLFDLLGPVSPVTTTPSTMITPTNTVGNPTNQTHSTSTLNSKPMVSPTTPKQNSTNMTSFPALKSDDIWAQASKLVSLDSLGKETKTTKQPTKPSMNSLAQANSSSWAVKGTWTGAQPLQQNSTN
ncbi:16977_t:CDS:2, partial [Dentiscutata heterogama]